MLKLTYTVLPVNLYQPGQEWNLKYPLYLG